MNEDINNPVSFVTSKTINPPTATVIIEGYSFDVNEYTLRNIQVAVKEKEISHEDIEIISHTGTKHTIDERGFVSPNMPTGFWDVSYNLSFKLMD